jgi:hypothetical protein
MAMAMAGRTKSIAASPLLQTAGLRETETIP